MQPKWSKEQDRQERDTSARERYSDFFTDPDHVSRVTNVEQILKNGFGKRFKVVPTARTGRSDPFTAVAAFIPGQDVDHEYMTGLVNDRKYDVEHQLRSISNIKYDTNKKGHYIVHVK